MAHMPLRSRQIQDLFFLVLRMWERAVNLIYPMFVISQKRNILAGSSALNHGVGT